MYPDHDWADEGIDCKDPSRTPFSIAKNEVNDHYHFMGGADRYWIQPAALLRREDRPRKEILFLVESDEEQDIANEFARYFQMETGFDFAPYHSNETRPTSERVFLIRTPELLNASYDFMVGAVGIETTGEGSAVVMWFWLHPFARGSAHSSLALTAWETLEQRFGELRVLAPISIPMRRFLANNRPDAECVELRY